MKFTLCSMEEAGTCCCCAGVEACEPSRFGAPTQTQTTLATPAKTTITTGTTKRRGLLPWCLCLCLECCWCVERAMGRAPQSGVEIARRRPRRS